MNDNLPEAIDRISELAQRRMVEAPTTTTVLGREYLVHPNGQVVEVKPLLPALDLPSMESIDGIVEMCRQYGAPGDTVVTVGDKGIIVRMRTRLANDYEGHQRTHTPYFSGDAPPKGRIEVLALLTWLDLHEGHVGMTDITDEQGAAVRQAFSSLRAVSGNSVKIKERGGVIDVKFEGETKVETEVPLPKIITVAHRRGLREFKTAHRYRVFATATRDAGLSISLEHLATDGAHERFVSVAVSELRRLLGEGWIVAEGA